MDEPETKLLGDPLPFYLIGFASWCPLAPKVQLCHSKARILFFLIPGDEVIKKGTVGRFGRIRV